MFKASALMLVSGVLFASASFAESWSAPIQCTVGTQVGRGAVQLNSLSGTTYGTFSKAVETQIVNSSGAVIREVFNFAFKVQLTSTDIYTLSITDTDRNTTLSNDTYIPSGGIGTGNLTSTQDYSTRGGVGVPYPRFMVALKCELRSQVTSGIPDVTPGPPR